MKVATTRAELHIIRHKSIQVVAEGIGLENYRKIPKISPGAYIFKALDLYLEVNLSFLLCFTLYLGAIFQVQAPGGSYLEGRFNRGFFGLPVWGAYIWRGLFSEFYGI